jgi:hypothetical protein
MFHRSVSVERLLRFFWFGKTRVFDP